MMSSVLTTSRRLLDEVGEFAGFFLIVCSFNALYMSITGFNDGLLSGIIALLFMLIVATLLSILGRAMLRGGPISGFLGAVLLSAFGAMSALHDSRTVAEHSYYSGLAFVEFALSIALLVKIVSDRYVR
jgi:hypothetical protein